MNEELMNKAESKVEDSWSIRLCRSILMSKLKKIETGSLRIVERGEVHQFGYVESANGAQAPQATVVVNDPRVWLQIVLNGVTGSGEAYMQGWWASTHLTDVIRLFVVNRHVMQEMNGWKTVPIEIVRKLLHWSNRNTLNGSKKNISAHYDLGNDFFSLFLDNNMMYSSAVFKTGARTLEAASLEKLRIICDGLELTENDHLLEIGTGWGGMAIFAAQNYGCRVTTTTISQEQYDKAVERVNKAGLQDKVTVLLKDYRLLEGQYDKLVSIEMIEAVGAEYFPEFFRKCSSLLKENGLMLIQAITIQDQLFQAYRRSVDFIRQYIFPGGCLPSIYELSKNASLHSNMQLTSINDITFDYALTLQHWRERFLDKMSEVKSQGFDGRFVRMWEFYLAYCEGGFIERSIGTQQLLFSKPRYRANEYTEGLIG